MDDPRSAPVVLGIVGALASGKSTVARLLERRGARVVDADRIGHQMLKNPQVRQAITEVFGRQILDGSGEVSRPRLARAAFGRPAEVEKLNRIMHPPIIVEIRAQVAGLRKEPGVELVVLDAALLVETNLDDELCDALLFLDAPAELRLERALADRKMSAAQFHKRESAQFSAERKKEKADFRLINAGSLEELECKLEGLWPELCRMTRVAQSEHNATL